MIKFYYGTVGSGKSMHLIAEYLNMKRKFPEKVVKLCKPASDTRTNGVYTRFGDVEISADYLVKPLDFSCEESHDAFIQSADIFFIDEAQFIPECFVNDCCYQSRFGYEFHFYGLRNDIRKHMWPSINTLMNNADYIIELPTTCELCKKQKASFNKALKPVEDAQNSPGFHFIPVCGSCWAKD